MKQRMYAYKSNEGTIMFIYPTKKLVQMCFPNMNPKCGKIILVDVVEIIRKKGKLSEK